MDTALALQAGMMGKFFEINPSPSFIVDAQVQVLALNPAAARLLGRTPEEVLAQVRRRAGELLACAHTCDTGERCGAAPECRTCVVHTSVAQAASLQSVHRRLAHLQLQRRGQPVDFVAYVSVAPFEHEGRTLFVMILEDVSDLVRLGRSVSVCPWCRRTRLDERFWESVEALLNTQLQVEVTRSICDHCAAGHGE